MLEDLDRAMQKWGTSGKFDPFDDIYNVRGELLFIRGRLTTLIDGFPNHNSRRIVQGSRG